ncbi:MAG: RNA methyltransferase [Puniceicoccaceae bacterium]|nr:MAG: RNA methyltransferase [Puniceicoccaceae bacterium]
MSMNDSNPAPDPARALALRLLEDCLHAGRRLDHLSERIPAAWPPEHAGRCRSLLYGPVRHLGLLRAALAPHLRRQPRQRLEAYLLMAAFELLDAPERAPLIVDHAVAQSLAQGFSRGEAGFLNAVLRRLPPALSALRHPGAPNAEALATACSHPEWLVRRWLSAHGLDRTRALLEGNQQPAPVFARLRSGPPPAGLEPTDWPDFLAVPPGRGLPPGLRAALDAGTVYLQNPATRRSVDLAEPRPGESILDCCAAPGGKSLFLADRAGSTGRVHAVDLPGRRLDRLRSNCRSDRTPAPVAITGLDLLTAEPDAFTRLGWPARFDCVLLDVPCSNTGVLRHRPDVKWRLQPGDLADHAAHQLRFLQAAAGFVAPGGRLVYSTCSIEPEENEAVVEAFLATRPSDFSLASGCRSLPSPEGEDGAGAFLLHRSPNP